MNPIDLEHILIVVTIIGGVVALVLALFQIVDTYLDIGDKIRKRQAGTKNQNRNQSSSTIIRN